MSSWASIVDSTASEVGPESHLSPKAIRNRKCGDMNGMDTKTNVSGGRVEDRAGQASGRNLGSQRSKTRKPRRDRKGASQQKHPKSQEVSQESPSGKSNQRGDVKVGGKAKAVFAAPPPNAWQAVADTKERICGSIPHFSHADDENRDYCGDPQQEIDVATFDEKLHLSSNGDAHVLDKVMATDDDESSRASLALLSENSYRKMLEDQEGCVYSASPKGIKNPGNVCFANSVIQALLGTEPFCQILYHIGNASPSLDERKFPVLKSLSNIAKELQFFDRNEKLVESRSRRQNMATVNVRLVVALIQESFKIRYKGDQKLRQVEQEDAHEFLHCLLDALHQEFLQLQANKPSFQEDIPVQGDNDGDEWLTQTGKRAVKQQIVTTEAETKTSSIITQLFEGMQSTCISSRGNPPSVTMHPFLVVEIPLYDANIETLEGAIDALTAPETISGYRPRGQDNTCDASKAEKFNSLPRILAFHLMRFQFTGSTEKLQRRIKYDGTLKIKPSWLMSGSKDRHAEYELKATISHHGQSIARGHFTANVKHEGSWIHFNDEIIHGINLQKVFLDEPYLLLYERKV